MELLPIKLEIEEIINLKNPAKRLLEWAYDHGKLLKLYEDLLLETGDPWCLCQYAKSCIFKRLDTKYEEKIKQSEENWNVYCMMFGVNNET
jgi:hypothetical protein